MSPHHSLPRVVLSSQLPHNDKLHDPIPTLFARTQPNGTQPRCCTWLCNPRSPQEVQRVPANGANAVDGARKLVPTGSAKQGKVQIHAHYHQSSKTIAVEVDDMLPKTLPNTTAQYHQRSLNLWLETLTEKDNPQGQHPPRRRGEL